MRTMFTTTVMATAASALFAAVPCYAAQHYNTYNPIHYQSSSSYHYYSGGHYSSGNHHYQYMYNPMRNHYFGNQYLYSNTRRR